MKNIRKSQKKIMQILVAIFVLTVFVFVLAACGDGPSTPPTTPTKDIKDNDVLTDATSAADVVQVSGEYIFVLKKALLTIIKTSPNGEIEDRGQITLAQGNIYGYELIISSNKLIAVVEYNIEFIAADGFPTLIRMTNACMFDLDDLKGEDLDNVPQTTYMMRGNYYTTVILNDVLYVTSTFSTANVYNMENLSEVKYFVDGEERTIDTVESVISATPNFPTPRRCSFIMQISLSTSESMVALLEGMISDLVVSAEYIYPVFSRSTDKVTVVAQLSTNTFEYGGTVGITAHLIFDKHSINATSDYLYIVSSKEGYGTRLDVYDTKNLERVGILDQLAPGEKLYGVRYQDEYCYIVTYLQVDPVLKIDLSDPTAPVLVDELEIGGYNEVLHFIGDDLAIGLGYSGEMKKSISLFDVSGETTKFIEQYSSYALASSAMLLDYRSVTISRERHGIYLIGFSYSESYYLATEQIRRTSASLDRALYLNIVVLSYSADGLTEEKIISEKDLASYSESKYLIDLGAMRCVAIGDYLYFVSNKMIRSYSINDRYKVVSSITLNEMPMINL